MARAALLIPALLLLLPVFAAQAATSNTFFTNFETNAVIALDSLSFQPSSLSQGGSTDVTVSMSNSGEAMAAINITVTIRNSANTTVDSFSYSTTNVAGGQTLSLTRSYSTSSLSPGTYTANATGAYDTNVTNNIATTLEVTAAAVGGGGVIGGAGGTPRPIILPPAIVPKPGKISFSKTTVVREMQAGSGGIVSLLLRNTGETVHEIRLEITGIPDSWVALEAERSILLPGEARPVNFGLSVPAYAEPGDYLIEMRAAGEGTESIDYLVLRVKGYPDDYARPIVTKAIEINDLNSMTSITLLVKNPAKKEIEYMTVEEEIPRELGSGDIVFSDKPGRIIERNGRKIILFEFYGLAPGEQSSASYSVRGILREYSPYAKWMVGQVALARKVPTQELIRVVDFTSSMLSMGVSAPVDAYILYTGVEPLDVNVELQAPQGFSVSPPNVRVRLLPREVHPVRFFITAPQNAQSVHRMYLVIKGSDFTLSTGSSLLVDTETPSLLALTTGETGIRIEQVALGAIAAVLVLAGVLSAIGRIQRPKGPRYSQDRVASMETIKKLIREH